LKIYIGSDHAGYQLKETIKSYLTEKKIDFEDFGTYSFEAVDYPDIAKKVGEKVVKEGGEGILLCGAANGIAIAANKIRGVRAAVGYSTAAARSAKEDNNANIICFGARLQKSEEVLAILDAWLDSGFSKLERHKRRIEKIEKLEQNG
jgi:ribose 5-phosphate isomerase B